MSTITIRVMDSSRLELTALGVPDDIPVDELVEAMVEAMELPIQSTTGRPNRYRVNRRLEDGRLAQLDESLTLAGNGIEDGTTLHLTRETVADPDWIRLEMADPWQSKSTVWIVPVGVTVGELASCVIEASEHVASTLNGPTIRYQLNCRDQNGRLVSLDAHANIANLMRESVISVGSVLQLSTENLTHAYYLQLKIVQASRTTRWIVPADLKAGELVTWMVDQLKLPIIKYHGQTTRYQLSLQQPNGCFKYLDADKNLFSNGVQSNDTLHLVRPAKSRLRIFLCHSCQDKPHVRDLYEHLTRDGFRPWLDERNLLPGENWADKIRKEISASHVVAVCLSERSVAQEGYVHREIKLALNEAETKPEGAIFIIPVRLEDVEIPNLLSKWHCADLFKADGYSLLVDSLRERAERLKNNLGG